MKETRLGVLIIQTDGYPVENLDDLTAAAQKIFFGELYRAGLVIMAGVQKDTPVGVTGTMRRGWKVTVAGTPEEPQIIVSNATEYLLPTELGRRAAWVPLEPLTLWVRRKLGIKDIKKAKRVAYAISKHKSKNKTPGQKFVEKAVNRDLPRAGRQIKQVIEAKLVKLVSQGVSSGTQ